MKIIGTGFLSHQHHLRPLVRQFLRFIRTKDNCALSGARTRRQTGREHLSVCFWIDCRMQQLIELFRRDALHRRGAINQFLAGHIDGDPHRRRAGAFARARLQHPKLAALDREFAVLHIAVMFFQQLRDRVELLIDFWELFFQLADRIRRARAGDHVFALRI